MVTAIREVCIVYTCMYIYSVNVFLYTVCEKFALYIQIQILLILNPHIQMQILIFEKSIYM